MIRVLHYLVEMCEGAAYLVVPSVLVPLAGERVELQGGEGGGV